jgi:hypothetical protein
MASKAREESGGHQTCRLEENHPSGSRIDQKTQPKDNDEVPVTQMKTPEDTSVRKPASDFPLFH